MADIKRKKGLIILSIILLNKRQIKGNWKLSNPNTKITFFLLPRGRDLGDDF